MVYKSLNGTVRDHMMEMPTMFKFVTDANLRQTRYVDNSKLCLPTVSISKFLLIVFNMQLVLSETNCQCLFEKQRAPHLLSQPM